MKTLQIDIIQIIRAIREDHAHQLAHKNQQEIVDFYEQQAKQIMEQLRQRKLVEISQESSSRRD